jgi:phospholipid-binding lipoprotein MlaA
MFPSLRSPRPWLVLATLAVAGCASVPDRDPRDPLEPMNRAVYKFNDSVDRYAFRPLAVGYRKVVPTPARAGLHNFFQNLSLPIDIANDLLQFKLGAAARDTARLVVNTTLGVGGLFDPAGKLGLKDPNEDFGQTLGRWGVPSGPYLVLPFFGPSTLRDGTGRFAVDNQRFDPLRDHQPEHERYHAEVVGAVQTRSELLDVEGPLREAYDPYRFLRDAYLQRRKYLVHDGELPPEETDPYGEDPYADPLDEAAGDAPPPVEHEGSDAVEAAADEPPPR